MDVWNPRQRPIAVELYQVPLPRWKRARAVGCLNIAPAKAQSRFKLAMHDDVTGLLVKGRIVDPGDPLDPWPLVLIALQELLS